MLINTSNKFSKVIGIDLKFGDLGDIVRWCQFNTSGDWRYEIEDTAGIKPGSYKFYFDDEKDYINFMLWKK